MKRTLYIAGGFTLAFLMQSNLQAQNTQPKDTTMNRTVDVEQEYNPDILDASKVNVLPKVEEPTVSKKEVEYATTFFPATSIPADLHAGASYNVFKGVSVYARINNILNKKYQYYLGYPTEGLNFLGGLSFSF